MQTVGLNKIHEANEENGLRWRILSYIRYNMLHFPYKAKRPKTDNPGYDLVMNLLMKVSVINLYKGNIAC